MHGFLDKYTVAAAAALLGKNKYFRESIDSPDFKENIKNVSLTLPEIKGAGFYEVEASSSVGKLDPAFHVAQWLGPEYPTIIYHHGNNETPFKYGAASKNTFKLIFLDKKAAFMANLINLRAPFHNQGLKSYVAKLARLENFTIMLSASTVLVEALVQELKNMGSQKIIVSGSSLGGWVTNLHRSFYNSADVYIPMLAGAALDEVFTSSYYRKTASPLVTENSEAVKKALNFEKQYSLIKDENVFPLLAKFDQIIELERQKACYQGNSVKVLDKGHTTAALASGELRNHILNHL